MLYFLCMKGNVMDRDIKNRDLNYTFALSILFILFVQVLVEYQPQVWCSFIIKIVYAIHGNCSLEKWKREDKNFVLDLTTFFPSFFLLLG